MERKLVDRFAAGIAPCLPIELRDHALLKPITMSLFGMLNWNYLWFRENGPLSRRDYAKLAVTVLIEGAQALAVQNRRSQGNEFACKFNQVLLPICWKSAAE